MNIKDCKTIDKITNNNHRNLSCPDTVPVTLKGDDSSQTDGIVRIVKDLYQTDEEFKTVQEQHNANHALYYFYMIMEAAIRGRSTGNDCEKIRRINAHMMNLREYLGYDKSDLKDAINILLDELEQFKHVYRSRFDLFIYKNWEFIWLFAKAYGHHERCFSEEQYQKLQDIALGRFVLRFWWWKMKWIKASRKIKIMLKGLKKWM